MARLSPRLLPLLALLGWGATACSEPRVPGGVPVELGRTHILPSKVLGEDRELNVLLPRKYRRSRRPYGVLYLLDGGVEQDYPHIAGLSRLAAANEDYAELIVVGIRSQARTFELTHRAEDERYVRGLGFRSGGSEKFRRFLIEEVVPWVEKNYRSGARRALVGESLAGLFVVETMLRSPESFTDYVAVSPSLWWDARALAGQAPELLAKHDESPRRLYLTMANEGGTMQKGLDELMAALKAGAPKGLEWSYVDRSATETHGTIYHGAVYHALRTLFDTPHPEPTGTPWFLIEGAEPPG